MAIMTEINLKELLPEVERIARLAGAEVMKHYAGTRIYTKDDGSKVTDADLASETVILPALARLTPRIPIVSEERVATGEQPDISGGTFWTVDPIDGTNEFINKSDGFVVAIALVVGNRPALGVVYHPSLNLMYSAAGTGTASKISADGVRAPLAAKTSAGPIPHILLQQKYADMPYIKDYLERRFKGSAVRKDMSNGIFRACRIAEGLADMALVCTDKEEGRMAFWDVAPGQAIIESAGGRVETLEGNPLVYDAGDYYVSPHIVLSPLQAKTFKVRV